MDGPLCVIKDRLFIAKAKQLNLSEAALEGIVHKYINKRGNANDFPSDAYIMAQYAVQNIVSKEDVEELTTVWKKHFSTPITVDTLEEADLLRQEAQKYFKQEAVTVIPTNDGNYIVKVAQPKAASINVARPNGPIVFNEEQRNAINAAVTHINKVRAGNAEQKFFLIKGKAGTGKTTIVNEILKGMTTGTSVRPVVLFGAPSHKATSVLTNKINAPGFNLMNKSLAAMLGLKPNNEGEYVPDKSKTPPIKSASVVIIDEASMIGEEQFELIQEALKGKNIPVIFLGDTGQLPPVRKSRYYSNKKIDSDRLSPVFEDETIPSASLETRVRQGEDSPVLEYADGYWNFSQEKTEEYPNDLNAKTRVTDKGALIVQRNEIDLVDQLRPLFEEAKRTGNPNLVKIVTYTNEAVDDYNRRIREALYPNQDIKGFVKGDLIIFNDTYGDENGAVPNSLESAVLEVRPCPSSLPQIEGLELEEVERELITFKGPYGYNAEVPALIPTKKNRDKHQKNITSLGKYCKQHPNKWYLYWQYKNLYAANIGYAYAIDSHKSQGSTYDIVAVDAADINSVYPTTLKTKAQSMYTAITRASNVTIISSNTTNEGTIYTDIKAINDRINAVKDGTASDEEFVPATKEEIFTEVTEDDIEGLVKDPDRKKKFIKKRGKVDDKEYNKIVTGTIIDEEDDGEAESWSDEWADDDEEDEEEVKPKAKSLTSKERAYDQFVSAQKQLNSIIEFNKKSHTYVVNGKKADFSVTEFRDFVLGKKKNSNDFLEISSRLGDSHDAFLRDYFADTIKDSYPNLSANQIKKLRKQASKLETLLEKTFGEDAIFITDENLLKTVATVTYDGEQYTVAGTMDMVVIDKEGKIHIVDFKTKRANKSDTFSSGTLDEYGFQVSMYKAMVSSTSKLDVGKTVLAQFNLKYADPRTTTYSFKGDQIYVEVEGEDIKIEEADADIFSSGVFTDKLIGLSSDLANNYDVKVSQLKTNIQKQVEHKQVADRTKVTPKKGTGKMELFYVQDGKSFKRKGIRAVSTLGAILEGKRTSTTRVDNWDYWKKFKVGDIITFHDKNGKEVEVRITVAPHKIDENIDLDEWSEKEGWLPEVFTDMPMKRGKTLMYYAKRGEAFQFEYELASKSKNSDTSSDTIEVNSTVPKWKLLSNFGNKPFKVETESGTTREFKTVEHYFQWAKAIHCKKFAMANKILNADTAMEAKKLGRHILKMSETQIKSWDKISRNVMRKGMRLAFEQNKNAKELLLSTGNALLTHKLGGPFADILMELREEFGGTGKPTTIKEAEKEGRERAKKSKEVPKAPNKKETSSSQFIESKGDYPQRTKENAEWSDITLDLTESDKGSGGRNELTKRVAGDKYVHFKLTTEGDNTYDADEILAAIEEAGLPTKNIKLNIAGSEIGKLKNDQEKYNEEVTRLLKGLQELGVTISEIRSGGQTGVDEAGIIAAQRLGIKWSVNAPKGWKFRDAEGVDHEDEEAFKARFGTQGLSIGSIQEKKVDSNLHLEKIDDRYTPKANSDNEHFNATAESLRQKGWHVEFYSKKSRNSSSRTDATEKLISKLNSIANSKSRFATLAKLILDNNALPYNLKYFKIDNNRDDIEGHSAMWHSLVNLIEVLGNNVSEEEISKALLHELIHYNTEELLKAYKASPNSVSPSIRENIKELYSIIEYTKKYLTEHFNEKKFREIAERQNSNIGSRVFYAFDNQGDVEIDEFISEIFTNPGLQEVLNDIPYKETKQSLWDKIKECVQSIFGISINKGSVLEEALKASTEFITKATGETSYQGEKTSAEPAYTNEAMTLSIEGNPKKGFFELVKDREDNSYSLHFKTKSKKAMNESDFAEEALEDSEKEDMFKALIYAIPEGAQVSTRGTLSKGGIAALDNLGSRSNGALEKVGDRLAKDSDGNNTRIPIYKKLSEDEIAEASVKKVRKQVIATRKPSLDNVEEGFFGIEESNETDERFTTMVKLSVPKVARGVLTGSADAVIIKQIQSLPYSALVSLDTSVVNANFLYALDELLKNPNLHVVPTNEVVTLDPNSLEGMMAKEYAKAGKRLEYDSKTGKLKIPKFTTGYSIRDIEKAAMYDKLINNELLTQEELRTLSKATMYKLSEFITMIQSNKNGYKKILGKDSDKDFTQMSRIQIIEEIGLTPLLNEIKERIFNSAKRPDDTPISTLDKLDIIYDNWEAFIELGYDSLIGLEEIALDNNQHLAKDIKNDLDNNNEDSEDVIQEIYGSSVEHWQVGFRQVSAFNSLSKIIKRAVDSLYELDEDGNLIFDEFGIAKHLNAQVAVSKILHYTQGARSLDDVDAEGNLRKSSMLYMLKNNLSAEPWLQQVIDLLEDKYNEDGDIIKKADEQFKAQFYSNFKKYFQKYAITFKKSYTDKATGAKVETVLMKIINEHQYADTLIKESQAKENSFAIGGFKLKTKNGDINQENLTKLKAAFDKLTKFKEKAGNSSKVSKSLDLEEYHKTIKEIFDLLDIDTPADESLYNLFGVRRNLDELHKHLKHLIPSIKDGATITDNRDYKQIVDLAAKEMGLEMESVSYEAGKMYYSHVLPSYLGRLVTNLTSENMTPEEYKNFLQKEYLKYAWFKKDGKIRCRWLDRLSKSDEVRKNFEHTTSLHYLGTEYSDKSPMEYIASMMRMYFFDNNKKWAYFRVPMISNKPSEEYIKFERITTMFRETIAGYMEDVFMQELDRIQAVKERKKNINSDQRIVSKGKKETFDTRGEQFVFEDYLNKYLDGTFDQREEYKELSDEEQLKEQQFSLLLRAKVDGTLSEAGDDYARLRTLFKTITTRCIEENYQVARAQWVDEGFITLKPDGSIKSIAGGLKLSEEQLREFFWNDMFASIQILELTITDMAYYVDTEDLQKRLAELHAPGMQAYIKARDKKGNLYTKDGIERAIYIKDDMVKSSMLANLQRARQQIIDNTPKDRVQYVAKQLDSIIGAFQKVNFADAQGYSCPSSYRKKMGVFGNWDDRMEEAYQKVIHPEKYPDVNLSEMLDVLWQPLKPFVYTQIEKPGYNSVLPTLKVSVQNKLSEYALVMADALLQRAGMPNKLRAIYEFMEESQHNPDGTLNGEGIDTIMFMSAVNAGCMGVIDLNDVKDKEGNVVHYRTEEEVKEALSKAYTLENGKMVYSPDYVHEIPFEDYIIQQNVPAHFMEHEQAHGSQDRILTFADMLDVDPNTGNPNYLIIDGKKVSVAEAKKNYFEAIAENINDSVNELIKRFKLENEDPRARNVALSKVLVDTILKDSRYGADLLWACKTNKEGEFNIPLSDPIHSNRIQQLLNSIIKNTINKQEIAGGPVVQVSNWGVSDKLHVRFKNNENKLLLTEDEFNNLKDPFPDDSLTPRDFKNHPERWKQIEDFEDYDEYTGDQAGVAYFEALAPVPDENYFKDFTKKDKNGNEYIDIEEMEKANPDLLYMIGYRIPTESKYSMVPIKIVGFLPRTGGEGLMLPADITSLAGSDFDIDKEYIMRFVFDRIEKDGKVTYEKPKSGRGYRNNLIIATQLAVLQSEQVQKQLFTPGNFDEPKKYGYLINYVQNRAAKTGEDPEAIWEEAMKVSEKMSVDDLNDWLKKKNKTPMNLIFNHVQVQFHKQNMTAGKLIGIFAQANVSHAFISLVEDTRLAIPVENSFTLNDIKVEGNFLIDEILTKDRSINISNNLAALLAASVDAVKDPILNLININIDTANVVTALLRMGFTLETVSLLASQPVLKKLVRDFAIAKAEGKYPKMRDLIAEAIGALPADITSVEEIHVTNEELVANLNGDSPLTNYMVLQIFSRMQDIADTFGDITHMTRYNSITSAVGPFATDTMLQRIKDKAFMDNPMITESIIEACNNPILYAFRDGSERIERRLLGENLIQAGGKFEIALRELGTKLGFSRGVPAKIANAFSDFYMSFYVNDSAEDSVFDLSFENRKRVLTEFPANFLRLKRKYKGNLLIDSIQYAEEDAEEFPILKLKTRGLSSTTIEDIKNAWITLYNNADSRDLAISIAEYNYFRGSFGFSPKTFMNLTPNIIKNGFNAYINVLNKKSSYVETIDRSERIINQFILHHPELITDNFYSLNKYNPSQIEDDVYGTCISIDRKPEEEEEDSNKKKAPKPIMVAKPFLRIDGKTYFVVKNDLNSSSIILKEVDELGGDGQGCELSVNENFPKTIYSESKSTRKDRKNSDEGASQSKEILDKDALGVLLDQLFDDDKALEEVLNLSAKKAVKSINTALEEQGKTARLSSVGRQVNILVKVLESVEGIDNPREILNGAQDTLEDALKHLCS